MYTRTVIPSHIFYKYKENPNDMNVLVNNSFSSNGELITVNTEERRVSTSPAIIYSEFVTCRHLTFAHFSTVFLTWEAGQFFNIINLLFLLH